VNNYALDAAISKIVVNVVVIVVVFLIKILYMPHMELLLVGDLAIMLEEFIAVLYVVLNGNFSEKWMILDI
jgi:hypothetical protein